MKKNKMILLILFAVLVIGSFLISTADSPIINLKTLQKFLQIGE